MERIESVQNARVKEWAKLGKRKGREQAGSFIVEGEHVVEEAIKQEAPIEALLMTEAFPATEIISQFAQTNPSICFQVSDTIMRRLSETETPQGIMAITKIQKDELESFIHKKYLLLLDAIQDPGNLGTIIRAADAAGVDGIILGNGTVDPHNSKVVRSTMGSIFHIPIIQANLAEIIGQLQQHEYTFIAASLEGAVAYDEQDYTGSIGIVIGNEANGVSEEILRACSSRIKIPLYGRAESLNAAIAAGIIMYEATRQRKQVAPKAPIDYN
ncbi:hypothetical protein BEP19_05140 [Ammoniphilus oxalaticus]|uniref:RNA 2-O ribose methyltransferase substrate binding domain-containing protein n=1 Tax=Ammoniphilus oxalaticus TaxID=66863 RepID=A0A419SKX4_9BACL|nr:RNA methyltransferase [Ammoniphilus oxalaticus]RKD24651.1 hypothetical protein BEP19_05140 [Ammoniphilus oxalaticus]